VFVEKPLCLSEFQLNEIANLYSTQFCVSVLKTQHNYKVMHSNFKSKGRPGNLTREGQFKGFSLNSLIWIRNDVAVS
ncbi:MAG: hypothetical protein KJ826_18985, partial [Proteobacteria bacterium]|nr:hypothetical protein [Pseudomonadota bacterium]